MFECKECGVVLVDELMEDDTWGGVYCLACWDAAQDPAYQASLAAEQAADERIAYEYDQAQAAKYGALLRRFEEE